jgi:hypothetical protein
VTFVALVYTRIDLPSRPLTPSFRPRHSVKAEINQDLDAGLGVTQKSVICLNQHLKFNPKTGVCCKVDYDWDTTKGECSASLGLINTNPAKNCQQLLDLGHTVDKHFWVKPTSIAAFQVWCTFNGDYPGSALVIRKPGRVNGLERHVKERATPCTLAGGGDSRQYCKIHDNQINALNSVSVQMDPYISLSYKSTSPNPRCRGYARKACVWTLGGQAGGSCQNAPSRNTGRYCSRTNANGGYRGMDGYYCNNGINYNQNNEYPSNIQEQNRPFIIWEHSGGSQRHWKEAAFSTYLQDLLQHMIYVVDIRAIKLFFLSMCVSVRLRIIIPSSCTPLLARRHSLCNVCRMHGFCRRPRTEVQTYGKYRDKLYFCALLRMTEVGLFLTMEQHHDRSLGSQMLQPTH